MIAKPEFVVDRRTTLRWLAASIAAKTMLSGCAGTEAQAGADALARLGLPAVPDGVTYGTDPDLMHPAVPWRRTLTASQLQIAAALGDAILPAGELSPSASALGVQHFIDEWVSAPYPAQQADRKVLLDGLLWLEQESLDRFAASFVDAKDEEQRAILDDIAFAARIKPGLESAAGFFRLFRHLAMSAYYSTDAGMRELGYVGNLPVAGTYPGPTPEAMAHLQEALKRLGLA